MISILKPFVSDYPVTFAFGEKPDWYIKLFGVAHNGIDFGTPDNTEIRACDDGFIEYADDIPDDDGKGINLRHSWGISQYWHLNELRAKAGQKVAKGDIIALSGHTGISFGAHLHFGIRIEELIGNATRGWVDATPYFSVAPAPTAPVETSHSLYQVVQGDSLWSIAERLMGSGLKWMLIFQANLDKIQDPNLIYAGMALKIPNEI